MQKNAFIAIIGRPNVGKSSLLNAFLGQKVAIVSPKPQTTRTRITGVLTEGDLQMVFIDTPGLHKPRTALGECMNKAVGDGMDDVEACLLVTEAGAPFSKADADLIARMHQRKIPAILAINKIDLLQKEVLLTQILEWSNRFEFAAIVPVSAKQGDGVDELLGELKRFSVEGPHFFENDTLTDQPERVLASEYIREQLLHRLDKEVPHGIAVGVERFRERDDGILDLEAVIYCERERHKGIIIGKKGAMLKQVGSAAREALESFFACRINLQLWVKVKEDWRNREGLIHNFGLD